MRLFSFLFSLSFLISFSASAEFTHHLIEEPTESGHVKYTVIEEDLSLRDNPDQISQYVIYKKVSFPGDTTIMAEALKQSPGLKAAAKDLEKSLEFESMLLNKPMAPPPPPPAAKPLWVAVKNTWTAQDELDYQAWFEANVGLDFNKGTALLADCADVGLLFRWAYAHDKQLPVANTLSGSGKLFGHFSSSSSWDKLPSNPDWRKDERFKQAMRYLFDNTYTHSIFDDLYPTELNPTYVHPGSLYMIIRKVSGHTQTIWKIDAANAGMRTLWGNEPSAETIFQSWFIWEPAVENVFGSWRWPVYQNGAWKLVAAKSMPGYSTEQFAKRKDLGEDLFQTWVLSGLGLVDYDEVKASREIQTVKEALQYRVNATATGALICGYSPCDPAGTDYDSYSTNSRDARIFQAQAALLKTIAAAGGVNATSIQTALTKAGVDDILLNGFPYTYKDFILNEALMKNIKADANLTFNQRWGLDQFPDVVSQFKLYAQQLKINVTARVETVDNANYYCFQNKCDTSTTAIQAMNTVKLDAGLSRLANQISPLLQSSQVRGPVLDQVAQEFKSLLASNWYPESITNPLCEDPSKCTMYDVIWKDNGLARVKTWKSQPEDSPTSRWGL